MDFWSTVHGPRSTVFPLESPWTVDRGPWTHLWRGKCKLRTQQGKLIFIVPFSIVFIPIVLSKIGFLFKTKTFDQSDGWGVSNINDPKNLVGVFVGENMRKQ